MNYDAFSHGQTLSKIWLCEELEKVLPPSPSVAILGSWHNIMAFMMVTRQPTAYRNILGIDIDSSAVKVADKVCNAWMFDEPTKVRNIVADAGTYDLSDFGVIINCSSEHMRTDWFGNVCPGTLVCIQSSDVTIAEHPWLVSNPSRTLEEMMEKYPLNRVLFSGEKAITYSDWGYKRFMLIGTK